MQWNGLYQLISSETKNDLEKFASVRNMHQVAVRLLRALPIPAATAGLFWEPQLWLS